MKTQNKKCIFYDNGNCVAERKFLIVPSKLLEQAKCDTNNCPFKRSDAFKKRILINRVFSYYYLLLFIISLGMSIYFIFKHNFYGVIIMLVLGLLFFIIAMLMNLDIQNKTLAYFMFRRKV